ncbi:MAG: protease inhibitor I42 family protein [Clostridium neonatale]
MNISLEGNPIASCGWEYSTKTYGIINEDSDEYIPNNNGLYGSGGIYTWKFLALKEGTTEITFRYSQPWDKEKVYEIKTYICTVDKELNIFIKEKYLVILLYI